MTRTHLRVRLTLFFLAIAAVAAAQPPLEPRHSELIEAFAQRFPPPMHDEAQLRDDWTPRLVEQFAFSFPGEGWGWKSAGGGRPPSSDVIARQAGGRLWGYDLIIGAGTGSARLETRAGALDITGQQFIPKSAVNHLGTSGGGGPGPGNPGGGDPPPATDLAPVLHRLDLLVGQLDRVIAALAQLDQLSHLPARLDTLSEELRKTQAAVAESAERVRAEVARGVRIRF